MRSPEHRNQRQNNDASHYKTPEAFKVLPPEDDEIPPDPPYAPQPYRLTPSSRRHKNTAFAILAESGSRPGSRSPSPTGRVSPFRGRGFNATGSRHASPVPSPPPEEKSTHVSPHRSKIPKLTRRSSATVFGEIVKDYQSSPTRRKLNQQLSQSLTNISSRKNSNRPPPSPRRPEGYGRAPAPAFQRLSPIVGSSPEPSQSQSSPRNSNNRSKQNSRFNSPIRNQAAKKPPRGSSRPSSRNPSRNTSREPSPSKNPASPSRKAVKNYKNVQAKVNSFTRPKPKVPPKPQVLSERSEDSDTINTSKRKLERKESIVRSNSKSSVISNTTLNRNINNNKNNNNKEEINKDITKEKEEGKGGMKKAESVVKLSEMILPSASTVVTNTTTTVTQPLKIEARIESEVKTDKTISPMVDGRVLSATSVSNAMNKMNDSVLNTQTLMKEHALPKLSPAANTIIAMSKEFNHNPMPHPRNATTALPSVETVNNSKPGIIPARVLEEHVQNHMMSKLISPDHNMVGNSVQKSVSDRMKEARSVVAHDGKPIRITVKEKPMNAEVQSGNIRFDTSNGLNERPGLPPVPPATNDPTPPEQAPPKGNVCTRFFSGCKKKTACACCNKQKEVDEEEPKKLVEEVAGKRGCFSCCKRKKPDVTINIESDEPKSKFWDRFKCCNRNKVSDTTTCFPSRKRKDSWVETRQSSLEEAFQQKSKKCSKTCCTGFLRKMFCMDRCCKSKKKIEEERISRRASTMSKKKSLTPEVAPEEIKPKLDISLVEHSSHMKGAIPVLPVSLAWFCLVMNCIAPGTGTVFSGMFCLCLGIPRFSQKDGARQRFGAFIIDLIIGFGQFFTVLFCLVGWGWSIWWGVIMLRIAKKHQKIKILEANLERQEATIRQVSTLHQNHRETERRL